MENSKTCKLHYNVSFHRWTSGIYKYGDIAYLHVYKVLKHFENIIKLKHFKCKLPSIRNVRTNYTIYITMYTTGHAVPLNSLRLIKA